MFVIIGTTKGDDLIRPETNALAASENKAALEATMSVWAAERDHAIKRYPEESYRIYSAYKIFEVPTIA